MVKQKTASPKSYWNLLKRIVGIGKRKKEIPNEAVLDGTVLHGEEVLEVWQKAFQKLGTLDENDIDFDKAFLDETKEEVTNGRNVNWRVSRTKSIAQLSLTKS